MRKTGLLAAAALLSAMPQVAHAGGSLPTPKIERAQEADPLVYDAQLSQLDINGRFVLWLVGQNLGPDDYFHPADSGYVHLYVRGIGADNRAGNWQACGEGDCVMYGATSQGAIQVGIRPGYYIAQSGAHLQFKVWISLGPVGGDDPTNAGAQTSDWSNVFTVDRAAAGVTKPVPPKTPPVIQRVKPGQWVLAPGKAQDWTVLVYGDHLCGGQVGVALNGAVVATPGGCTGVDIDGSFLPAGTALLKFDLPEGYRRAGDYTLTLRASDGESNPKLVMVRNMPITQIDRPAPQVTVPRQTAQPPSGAGQIAQPPLRIKLPPAPRPN